MRGRGGSQRPYERGNDRGGRGEKSPHSGLHCGGLSGKEPKNEFSEGETNKKQEKEVRSGGKTAGEDKWRGER